MMVSFSVTLQQGVVGGADAGCSASALVMLTATSKFFAQITTHEFRSQRAQHDTATPQGHSPVPDVVEARAYNLWPHAADPTELRILVKDQLRRLLSFMTDQFEHEI